MSEELEKVGITVPFPQLDVYVHPVAPAVADALGET